MLKAFAVLDESGQAALRRDLITLLGEFNRADDGTVVVHSEYLEAVITKR